MDVKTYCIILDSDGHFGISDITKREQTIELLKKLSDGDVWANEADSYLADANLKDESELLKVGHKTWVEFVNYFVQRGTMEIKTVIS